jgi:hypothetical protein
MVMGEFHSRFHFAGCGRLPTLVTVTWRLSMAPRSVSPYKGNEIGIGSGVIVLALVHMPPDMKTRDYWQNLACCTDGPRYHPVCQWRLASSLIIVVASSLDLFYHSHSHASQTPRCS